MAVTIWKLITVKSGNFSNSNFRNSLNWNQWLQLPIEYCELSREAVVAVRLIDFAEKKCVGGSVFRLFNDLGEYYHGTKDICIWPNREPDPDYGNSNTPSSGKQDSNHQMPRLQPLVDKYNRQQLPKVDWLDKLVFREIEQINEKEKQSGILINSLLFWNQIQIRSIRSKLDALPKITITRLNYENFQFFVFWNFLAWNRELEL